MIRIAQRHRNDVIEQVRQLCGEVRGKQREPLQAFECRRSHPILVERVDDLVGGDFSADAPLQLHDLLAGEEADRFGERTLLGGGLRFYVLDRPAASLAGQAVREDCPFRLPQAPESVGVDRERDVARQASRVSSRARADRAHLPTFLSVGR